MYNINNIIRRCAFDSFARQNSLIIRFSKYIYTYDIEYTESFFRNSIGQLAFVPCSLYGETKDMIPLDDGCNDGDNNIIILFIYI